MKKSTITVLIVSLVLIIGGGALFVGGVLSVGGIAAAKDMLAKHGVFIGKGIQIDVNLGDRIMKYSDMDPIYFAKEDVEALELETGAAEVEVIQGNQDDDICVRTDGNYDIFVKNSTLFINAENVVGNHKLVLEIPSDMVFDRVDIEAGASVIQIDALNTKKLEADIGAGEIIIDQLSVKKLDLSVGMGNAEIFLEGSEEDYNYEIECGAGNVDIGNESFGGLASDRRINNDADATIEIECGMGNVTIEF